MRLRPFHICFTLYGRAGKHTSRRALRIFDFIRTGLERLARLYAVFLHYRKLRSLGCFNIAPYRFLREFFPFFGSRSVRKQGVGLLPHGIITIILS